MFGKALSAVADEYTGENEVNMQAWRKIGELPPAHWFETSWM